MRAHRAVARHALHARSLLVSSSHYAAYTAAAAAYSAATPIAAAAVRCMSHATTPARAAAAPSVAAAPAASTSAPPVPPVSWAARCPTSQLHPPLSPADEAARETSFARRIAQQSRLFAAHCNAATDPHVQVVLDMAFASTREAPQLAGSLAAQLVNCIGINRRADRPVKLWATHFPTRELGWCQWKPVHDPRCMQMQTQEDAAGAFDASCSSPAPYPPLFETPLELYKGTKPRPRVAAAPFAIAKEAIGGGTAPAAASAAIAASTPVDPFTASLMWGDARFNGTVTPSQSLTRSWEVSVDPRSLDQVFRPESVVYLCPESPNLLERVESGPIVYAIGGLVDRTVVKGVSYARAKAAGFRTARLPIRETIGPVSKASSLNIDTVFSMLLDWAQMDRAARLQREEQQQEGGDASLAPMSDAETHAHNRQLWHRVFTKHIPRRYWLMSGRQPPPREQGPADAAALADTPEGVAPPRSHEQISAASFKQTHLRKQEFKFCFQRHRPKFTPQHILEERSRAANATAVPLEGAATELN